MGLRTIKQTTRRAKSKTSMMTPNTFTPAIIQSIAVQAPETIRLTFSTRVMATRMPGFTAGDAFGNTVVSMTQVSATEVDLTFDGDVEDTEMSVKEHDPGIRTSSGGFVPAGTYSLAVTP